VAPPSLRNFLLDLEYTEVSLSLIGSERDPEIIQEYQDVFNSCEQRIRQIFRGAVCLAARLLEN